MTIVDAPSLDIADPADEALAAALDVPCAPLIAEAIRYWRRIRPKSGLLPGRQHFDPVEVPKLLPHLGLFEVTREPRFRLKVRMAGTKLVDAYGTGRVGRFLDDFIPNFDRSLTAKHYRRVATEGVPVWYRGKQSIELGKSFLPIERLQLPLATDGRTVDLILGVFLLKYSDGRPH